MEKSPNIEESAEQFNEPTAPEMPSEATAGLAARLKAVQDQVAQYLREERFDDAKRALREVEQIKNEESKIQLLAEAKAERENALLLTNEGLLAEARQALERADELERKALGRKRSPQRLIGAVRSWLPNRAKTAQNESNATENSEPVATDPVTESLQIVSRHSKIAAAVGLLPGGLLNFVAVFAVQVPMVWRIAKTFGHNVTKEQIRGVLMTMLTSVIPGIVGHGTGAAIASIPAAVAGTVVYFVATPILAYALTRAVGNVFIMHFESGGTLLDFDPKAFTEYFVNEFKKAGGTLRQEKEPEPATSGASA